MVIRLSSPVHHMGVTADRHHLRSEIVTNPQQDFYIRFAIYTAIRI